MFFFVADFACEIKCGGTTESKDIIYLSVKFNLYNQTEY